MAIKALQFNIYSCQFFFQLCVVSLVIRNQIKWNETLLSVKETQDITKDCYFVMVSLLCMSYFLRLQIPLWAYSQNLFNKEMSHLGTGGIFHFVSQTYWYLLSFIIWMNWFFYTRQNTYEQQVQFARKHVQHDSACS